MRNIMLDLETMGISSNAAIIAIGAVEFDDDLGITDEFYTTIDLQSCIDKGLILDASTIIWWMKQGDDARKEFFRKGIKLKDALIEFRRWVDQDQTDHLQVWGNGSSFDNVILANAYKSFKVEKPWPYWGDRCFRTLKSSFPKIKNMPETNVTHNALHDAIWQAEYLVELVEENNLNEVL